MEIKFTDLETDTNVIVDMPWDGNSYVGPSIHINECHTRWGKVLRVGIGTPDNPERWFYTREVSIVKKEEAT